MPTCHSTNAFALNLLSTDDVSEGTLVITDNQTAGQGQRGNHWEAEPGKNLTFSLIYFPRFLPIEDRFFLNIFTSLAVYQTLTFFTSKKINVKWPNDIYCGSKKNAGILIQNHIKGKEFHSSVIGIGLNVNQTSFNEPKATSIALETGEVVEKELVLKYLLERLEFLYLMVKKGEKNELKKSYLSSLFWINSTHTFQDLSGKYFEGVIVDIDNAGCLMVQTKEDLKAFAFKEIIFVS
jgi:BirA family biotin operon repressor/biotin-[acetyl-CoA-carboxylase] ligase